MNIHDLAVKVRPRTTYEAIDLGIVLAQSWWTSIAPVWLMMLFLWASLVYVLSPSPEIGILLVWWAKPLLARPVLWVMSRKMFGASVSVFQTLREVPKLLFKLPIFLNMTLFRFSPYQRLYLPVWMLEGLSGEGLRLRKTLFHKHLGGEAIAVLCFFVFIEWFVLFFSTWILCLMFLPQEYHELMPEVGALFYTWYGYVAYVLVTAALEPFVVAVFFSLYLNCRTILEGWDLELAFRKLADRLTGPKTGLSMVLLLLLIGWTLPSSDIQAQTQELQEVVEQASPADPEPNPAQDASTDAEAKTPTHPEERALVDAVFKEPPFFNGKKKIKVWEPRKAEAKEASPSFSGLELVDLFLASLVKIVVLLLVLALIILLVRFLIQLKTKGKGKPAAKKTSARESAVLHHLIKPETLPTDLLGAARTAYETGQTRQAMSLLFRGCLWHLVNQRKLNIATVATEGECVTLVQKRLPELATFFAQLVDAWQRVAYGHKPLTPEEFDVLCQEWRHHLVESAS